MRSLARSRPVGPTIVGTALVFMGANLLMFELDISGAQPLHLLVLWCGVAVANIAAGLAMLAWRPLAWRACLTVATLDIVVSVATTIIYGPGGLAGESFALVLPVLIIGYLLTDDARRSLLTE
jgi:hypothetical protein